ncbi:hypothetical protein AMATHDRAFT_64739 [Amanita thiersii Skay4041]|uniref:Uncharacterized protein n=1 Tax=Amanita thiersii Skay4041 TaxID=703135 RepID=A0A2A9NLU4_9AGAR|nr:hypothetical protein AMATHDRAFT_64739 [Amanita thiersii Skay4041]
MQTGVKDEPVYETRGVAQRIPRRQKNGYLVIAVTSLSQFLDEIPYGGGGGGGTSGEMAHSAENAMVVGHLYSSN